MARATRSSGTVDTALLITCGVVALILTVLPLNLREAIAAGLRRTVVAPLLTLQQQAERGRTAFLSREATISKVDSLALRAMQLSALEHENTRLRALLGLGSKLRTGFVVAEALHTGSMTEEHTLTLTAGATAGVRKSSPVIAPEGLIGVVKTVDPKLSLAIMWTHPDFRASATAVDGTASGIVSAHLGTGAQRYLLELRGVAFRDTLRSGTMIATSGLGGVFPRGIPIGTVLGEVPTTEKWTRTYLLKPAVRPPDVTAVMVLLPEPESETVQSAWSSLASADSAMRRIAAAGDSLTRDSLAAAQRRAAAAAAAAAARTGVDSAGTPPSPADSVRRGGAVREAPARDAGRRDSVRRDTGVRRDTTTRRDSAPRPRARADTTTRGPRGRQ